MAVLFIQIYVLSIKLTKATEQYKLKLAVSQVSIDNPNQTIDFK